MESIDLEMNDVFGEDMDVDDDIEALGALPDLTQNTQNEDNEDADNEEVNKRLKALSKGAAKKVVRKPQPKLDADRLTGERGIPILPKFGEKIKLKGKNHEAEDLKQIMRHMEHWAHRLFPKMPFDEVVERVDKLGSKGPVKTCIKKIRLDMPILTDEFVGSDNEDDVERNGEEDKEQGERNAESMWDELIEEEAEIRAKEVGNQSQSVGKQIEGSQGESRNPSSTSLDLPGTSQPEKQGNPGAFTQEQLERMERNKQLALERKMKKFGMASPALKKSQTSSEPSYTATPVRIAQLTQCEISQMPESSTEKSEENQSSEVIEAGPSQNILIEQKQEDAQRWHTQTDSNGGDDTNTCVGDDSQSSKKLADTSSKEQTDFSSIETAKDNSIEQTDTVSQQQMDEISKQQRADNSNLQMDDVSQQKIGVNSKQQTDDNSKQQTDNISKEQMDDNSKQQTNDVSKELVDKSFNQSQSQLRDISGKNIELSRNGDLNSNKSGRDKPNTESTLQSEELSEVIPIQNSENFVLKTVPCDTLCNIVSDVKKTTEKVDDIDNKENTEKDMHIKANNVS